MADYTDGHKAEPMTARDLSWARSHDWGVDAWQTADGTIHGLVDCTVYPDGSVAEEVRSFSSRRELRAWAGY